MTFNEQAERDAWQSWVNKSAPVLNSPESVTDKVGALRFHSQASWLACAKAKAGEVERVRADLLRIAEAVLHLLAPVSWQGRTDE